MFMEDLMVAGSDESVVTTRADQPGPTTEGLGASGGQHSECNQ